MKNFHFKKRDLFSGPHLLGVLLILSGIFALVSPSFLVVGSSTERVIVVGLGAFIIGLFILFSYSGTTIDFTQNKYKEYVSVGGYKLGQWSPLPAISSIHVIERSAVTSNTPNGISPTLSGKVTHYKVRLIANSGETIFALEYASEQKAVTAARQLADHLNANLILDIPEVE